MSTKKLLKLNSTYFSDHPEGEVNDPTDTLTETAGYMSAEEQLNRLFAAGAQLDAWRRATYDYGADEEVPDDAVDRTRDPDFDPAEGAEALARIETIGRRRRRELVAREEQPESESTEGAAADDAGAENEPPPRGAA